MSQNNDEGRHDLEDLYAYGLNWLDMLENGLNEADQEIARLNSLLERQNSQLVRIREALAADGGEAHGKF